MNWGCRGPTEQQYPKRFSLQIEARRADPGYDLLSKLMIRSEDEHHWSPTVVDRSLLALPLC